MALLIVSLIEPLELWLEPLIEVEPPMAPLMELADEAPIELPAPRFDRLLVPRLSAPVLAALPAEPAMS